MNKFAVAKSFAAVACLLAFLLIQPGARADQANQATKVTFSQSVQIPGRVLPAGTYWFILARDVTQNYEVRIYNSDRTIVYATVLTIDAQRSQPTAKGAFRFADYGVGEPQAVVTWFYSGETTGHEFLYPKQVSRELAKAKQLTIVAGN